MLIVPDGSPLEKVLARLEGVKRVGRGWVARCPAHPDRNPSLSVGVGADGRVLLKCFAGCDLHAILDAIGLEVRDLFPGEPDRWRWSRAPKLPVPRREPLPKPDEELRRKLEGLWSKGIPLDRPGAKVGRRYLQTRGIKLGALPAWPLLRVHPALPYRNGGQALGTFPALLARVEHPRFGLVALHRTYIASDGGGKAPVPSPKKLSRPTFPGATRGAGMRLLAVEGEEVGVAEGVETALAIAVATGLPVYAAISAGGLAAWLPPQGAKRVLIGADGDEAGRKAATTLARRLLAMGIRVRVAIAAEGRDWLDIVKAEDGEAPPSS